MEAMEDVQNQSADTFLWYENSEPQTESEIIDAKFAEWFKDDEESWPYTKMVIEQIKYRQSQMDGELIIHSLLNYSEIEPSLYPPIDFPGMKILFDLILKSPKLDETKAYSLIFYIIKDWNSGLSQKFAIRCLIPYNWVSLMEGYWSLDHWRFEDAVRCLGEPEVQVDFHQKVITTLVNHAGPHEALIYIDITKPNLSSEEDVGRLLNLLMQCDLIEAFFFLRDFAEQEMSVKLLRQMFDYCFEGAHRADKLNKLLHFPFNRDEETFLENYCLENNNPVHMEFFMMYAVHHHRQADAIKIYDQLRQELDGKGAKSVAFLKRARIIEEMRRNLPPVLKYVLAAETDDDMIQASSSYNYDGPINQEKSTPSPFEPVALTTRSPNTPVFTPSTVVSNNTLTPKNPFGSSQTVRTTLTPISGKSPTPLPNKSPFTTPVTHPSLDIKSAELKPIRRSPYVPDRRITRSMTKQRR